MIMAGRGSQSSELCPAFLLTDISTDTKMKKFIVLLSLIVSACTTIPTAKPDVKAVVQVATQPATTPTQNYAMTLSAADTAVAQAHGEANAAQDMARQAQLTSDAAARLMVDATVTHEAMQYQYTNMTAQAGAYTATAYTTAYPATASAQAQINNVRSTERVMTIIAPTQIAALAASKAYAETATAARWAEVFIKWTLGFCLLAIGLLALIRMMARPQIEAAEEPEEAAAIPMMVDPENPNRTVRYNPNVPCTLFQLQVLADLVINQHKTLAFNQWEGTEVYKSLKELRAFFVQNKFAKVLTGKDGELGIEPAGERFLSDTLYLSSPPPPFKCVVNDPPTASTGVKSQVWDAVGEVEV
jgi:hypothetical protein